LETLNLYEIAFKCASEGLLVVDDKGSVDAVNDRMTELFGYSKEEMMGQKIEMFIPTAVREHHVGLRKGYTENPRSRPMGMAGMNLQGQRKDGSVFPVEVSLNHFVSEGKNYVLGLITDVSQRVKMEKELINAKNNLYELNQELETLVIKRTEALEKSQQLYEMIAKNYPDGVINVLDKKFNYIFSEGKELAKLGYGSKDLIGTNYLSRLDSSLKELITSKLTKALYGSNQSCTIASNNQHYELNIVGIKDEKEVIDRILIVEINVTKQKQIEEEQRNALERERELGEMKSRFVSMASHEFRTPLSAILSSASLIEKYEKTEQQPNRLKHTERIKSSVANLTNILNDFLSLDKLSSNVVQSEVKEVNVCEIIEYAICELESIKKQDQEVCFEFLGGTDCIFKTDEKILKNIMLNLISNGLKYSHSDGKVMVKLYLDSDDLCIEVKDFGIGIPEQEQEKLFQRFFRAENVSNIQGTGLGLNIVKKYIEILEGEITFESKLNEGTTFLLKLPQKK
jgi:PAS domain S-box-containing protein